MTDLHSAQTGTKIIMDLGKTLGSMVALCTALWFFGEPYLEDYVDNHIEVYDQKLAEEKSSKVKLRTLLAGKMGVEEDEVHIELGRLYKTEESKFLQSKQDVNYVESKLTKELKELKDLMTNQSSLNEQERRRILAEIEIIKKELKLD